MSNQHTPGPWKVEDDSPSDYTDLRFAIYGDLDRADEGRAYRIAMTTDGHATAKANARLIAAAPELLSILAGVLQEYDESDTSNKWTGNFPALMTDARAALAKAEGK